MPIPYHSVTFFTKQPDGSFAQNVESGFTNDKDLFKEILKIVEQKDKNEKYRVRWGATEEPSYLGEIPDVEALKAFINRKANAEPEQTTPGFWSTPGLRQAVSDWNAAE